LREVEADPSCGMRSVCLLSARWRAAAYGMQAITSKGTIAFSSLSARWKRRLWGFRRRVYDNEYVNGLKCADVDY